MSEAICVDKTVEVRCSGVPHMYRSHFRLLIHSYISVSESCTYCTVQYTELTLYYVVFIVAELYCTVTSPIQVENTV
jgi:hypothetical protein